MTHRECPEQEAPVELEVGLLDGPRELGYEGVDLGQGRVALGQPGAQAVQGEQVLAAPTIDPVILKGFGEPVVTRESGGEDHTRVVAHRLGQPPAVGQLSAQRCGLVAHDQRDAGVSQGIEAGRDRQARRIVQRLVAGRVDGELLDDVERGVPAGQLDDIRRVVDGLERAATAGVLDQAGDPHVGHPLPHVLGQRGDELLAGQDARDVVVVEGALHTGQTQGGTGDDDRLVGVLGGDVLHPGLRGGGRRLVCRAARSRGSATCAVIQAHALLEHTGEELAEFADDLVRGPARCPGGSRSRGDRSGSSDRSGSRDRSNSSGSGSRDGDVDWGEPVPRGIQAAQGLVDGHGISELGVVGEQGHHVVVLGAQDVLDETVQRLLRADLDEDSSAGGIQGLQALDELDR